MRAIQIRSKAGISIADCLYLCDHDLLICIVDCMGYLPLGSYCPARRSYNQDCDYIDEIGDNLPVIECRKEDLDVCDLSRYEGCCGPDGSIPNIHDPSGVLIGWEFSDCWMSHHVQIAVDRVDLREIDAPSEGWFVAAVEFKGRKRIVDRAIARTRDEAELRLLGASIWRFSRWLRGDRKLEQELLQSLEILPYVEALEILGDDFQSYFQTKFGY